MDAEDPALGPPAKMVERAEELTPMLSQYYELCRQYDDCLVLFQVGDFYEAFCEAAETVSRLLEVTLTQREDSTGTYAMAGIPMDNAESYVDTLLDAGYRVAIADQVQDPEAVTGVVDRAVTRVITPGTLTEDELLADDANTFVACLTSASSAQARRREYGLALLDVSTGDFVATSADALDTLADEVSRFDPPEAITDLDAADEAGSGDHDVDGDDLPEAVDLDGVLGGNCMRSPTHPDTFDPERTREKVAAYFGDPDALLAGPAEVRACGALLSYAEYTRGGVVEGTQASGDGSTGSATGAGDATDDDGPPALGPDRLPPAGEARLGYINHLTRYDPREYVLLDAVAMRSLELFERRAVHGDEEATLAGVVDDTETAMGGRRLTEWLRRPLLDADRIRRRHDAVEALVRDPATRESVRVLLRDVYDVERLISRVSRGRADARDLRSLYETLEVVPEVAAELESVDCEPIAALCDELDPLADVRALIDDAIREDPPIEITEGGIIAEGYHDDLDDLRATEREGKRWIDDLEADERERTGIDSLKVGHNAVHGYYIEVTDPNLDRVPEDYQRRQTLKHSERYVTPELKEWEEEIVRAEGRADDLEYELFTDVRTSVADEAARIQAVADALARLDALASFAEVAATYDYARPELVDDRVIDIEGGRHPIVERRQDAFVPNGTRLTPDRRFTVLTGPNMSGKSTYMRQVALIVLLAQAGAFVPAAAARIGPIERIFTRVGASDDIAGGRSTFMIEMLELAEILRSADERSLVLLDEVGRGTSTADGLAIARSIAEHVHDDLGAFTLFATHHHDLTVTAETLPAATNRHFSADQHDGEIHFDHEIAPGPATASYGVEVAREAGVPESVVAGAREYLDRDARPADRSTDATAGDPAGAAADETTAVTDNGVEPESAATAAADRARTSGGADLDEGTAEALAELRETDVATLTPIEALNRLAEITELLD